MALHLVLWSLVLTAHVAAWPAEVPTQWGSIEHSLANSRNTTCVKETRFAATEALFERAATAVGPGLPGLVAQFYASSPHAPPGQPGKLNPPPADMLPAEHKRLFLGWLGESLKQEGPYTMELRAIGLQPFKVPAGVHAMSGGGQGYISGGLYNADMVSEALGWAGIPLETMGTVLDWGGSTGRSIAMWHAAFPKSNAHLADPIRKSIQWAANNLAPDIKSVASNARSTRTPYEKGTFDLVFAISIWSHYNFGANALPMLTEMHRIVKPGGVLVITTHGWPSLYSTITDKPTAKLATAALKAQGHFYVAAFPNNVDWDTDTKNSDWGMSWVDPKWLVAKLSPGFKPLLLLNGRSDCLQDVIVLQRN